MIKGNPHNDICKLKKNINAIQDLSFDLEDLKKSTTGFYDGLKDLISDWSFDAPSNMKYSDIKKEYLLNNSLELGDQYAFYVWFTGDRQEIPTSVGE